MHIPYDENQIDWGSALVYADGAYGTIDPRYLVIHWGGLTSDVEGVEAERRVLRSWQRYHMMSRGMRDIAYNYAVGDSGTVYRLRGLNPGGHVKCSTDRTPEGDSYCIASVGVVWIGGERAAGPSRAALESMADLVNLTGLDVKSHQQVKRENGSSTACPGPTWIGWVDEQGWKGNNVFGKWVQGWVVGIREDRVGTWNRFARLFDEPHLVVPRTFDPNSLPTAEAAGSETAYWYAMLDDETNIEWAGMYARRELEFWAAQSE